MADKSDGREECHNSSQWLEMSKQRHWSPQTTIIVPAGANQLQRRIK